MNDVALAKMLIGISEKKSLGLNYQEKLALTEAAKKLQKAASAMTAERIAGWDGPLFLEMRDRQGYFSVHPALLLSVEDRMTEDIIIEKEIFRFAVSGMKGTVSVMRRRYGEDWRCWTQMPNDDQRKKQKWFD